MKKKNSFNKKIKTNKISIKNSKIHLKNIEVKKDKKKEIEINLNDIKIKNYKPFKPRNNKYRYINKNNINADINNNYDILTQRSDKKNIFDNIDINKTDINRHKNTESEKIIYDSNDNSSELIKNSKNNKQLFNSSNSNIISDKNYNFNINIS